MSHFRRMSSLAAALLAVGCSQARAEGQVDPATLYEVSTEGTSARVKASEQGVFVLSIKSRSGAHISGEAPLKLELKGTQLKPGQEKLALKDSKAKTPEGKDFADVRFEVPFTGTGAGKGSLEAKLSFFICSEQLCAMQKKTFTLPVEVL